MSRLSGRTGHPRPICSVLRKGSMSRSGRMCSRVRRTRKQAGRAQAPNTNSAAGSGANAYSTSRFPVQEPCSSTVLSGVFWQGRSMLKWLLGSCAWLAGRQFGVAQSAWWLRLPRQQPGVLRQLHHETIRSANKGTATTALPTGCHLHYLHGISPGHHHDGNLVDHDSACDNHGIRAHRRTDCRDGIQDLCSAKHRVQYEFHYRLLSDLDGWYRWSTMGNRKIYARTHRYAHSFCHYDHSPGQIHILSDSTLTLCLSA